MHNILILRLNWFILRKYMFFLKKKNELNKHIVLCKLLSYNPCLADWQGTYHIYYLYLQFI